MARRHPIQGRSVGVGALPVPSNRVPSTPCSSIWRRSNTAAISSGVGKWSRCRAESASSLMRCASTLWAASRRLVARRRSSCVVRSSISRSICSTAATEEVESGVVGEVAREADPLLIEMVGFGLNPPLLVERARLSVGSFGEIADSELGRDVAVG